MDNFLGIGLPELILIAVIALLVLGPERLPGVMREGAKYIRMIRGMSKELTDQFREELDLLDEINPKRIFDEATDPDYEKKQAAKKAKSTKKSGAKKKIEPNQNAVSKTTVKKSDKAALDEASTDDATESPSGPTPSEGEAAASEPIAEGDVENTIASPEMLAETRDLSTRRVEEPRAVPVGVNGTSSVATQDDSAEGDEA